MSFRKSSRNQSFTVVYNEVAQHEHMTMEARGLLLFMLSLPENWDYHKTWLQTQCHGWGREKLAKVLKELEQLGYLIRTAKRSEDGKKLAGWDWEVLAESGLEPEVRQTRQSEKEVRQNSTKPDLRVSSQSGKQSVGNPTTTKETSLKNKKSKSVTSSEREKFFSVDQIIVDLHEMGMPQKETWYARKKAQEFIDRWPQSESLADACRYVTNAIDHAWKLEGKT